ALKLIRRYEISAAVVDVNLGGDNCFAVCQALFHRSIPFLFHTGHREADVLKAWPEAPLIVKPAGHDELVACLAALASRYRCLSPRANKPPRAGRDDIRASRLIGV